MSDQTYKIFGPRGVLHQGLDYFTPRKSQFDLVEAVEQAVTDKTSAVFEAGTGTGKTFAYLVPLILANQQAVISTSTISLQEQIVKVDLRELSDVLERKVSYSILKGRARYICPRRLELTKKGELGIKLSKERMEKFKRHVKIISDYAVNTSIGDREGVRNVERAAPIWPLVTSTPKNCTKNECEYYKEGKCFYYNALDRARSSDIIVANHALMLTRAALKIEAGDNGILPGRVVVFDEAHSLPDDLPRYFGKRLTTRELQTLLEQGHKLAVDLFNDNADLADAFIKLEEVNKNMLEVAKRKLQIGSSKSATFELDQELVSAKDRVRHRLVEITKFIDSDEYNNIRIYGRDLLAILQEFKERADFLSSWPRESSDSVSWVERTDSSFQFFVAPLDTHVKFRENFMDKVPCVMISATMSFDGKMDKFKQRIGAEKARELIVKSPFDYNTNAMMLFPADMPDPNSSGYCHAVSVLATKLVKSNRGKAFLLFSSWRNLNEVGQELKSSLPNDFTILEQGEDSAELLLRRFKNAETPHILLGTRTFWQGIDVRGKALSLVIVDKIPFAPPSDPLIEAQTAQLGDDGWKQIQLPRAALILKQAAGRLIRGENDRGVLVICDPRMNSKWYGEAVKKSLPPMKQTFDFNEACSFMERNQ